eukprot:scaffold656_cov57-Phaeocystis_antarctica.AAC.2
MGDGASIVTDACCRWGGRRARGGCRIRRPPKHAVKLARAVLAGMRDLTLVGVYRVGHASKLRDRGGDGCYAA